MVQNIGADQHLAVPTKGQADIHDGPYAERCPQCIKTVKRVVTAPLLVNGVPVLYGSEVRPFPQARSGHGPEWGTVAEIRWNSHTGETWLHCWEYGMNLVLRLSDIAEARWPEQPVLPEPERLAAALDKALPVDAFAVVTDTYGSLPGLVQELLAELATPAEPGHG